MAIFGLFLSAIQEISNRVLESRPMRALVGQCLLFVTYNLFCMIHRDEPNSDDACMHVLWLSIPGPMSSALIREVSYTVYWYLSYLAILCYALLIVPYHSVLSFQVP